VKKLLVLAIILRLFLAAFYFHPDIKTYNFQASFLKKGVFNIYSYLIDNKKTLPLKEEFVYSPLTYFVLGGYQAVVSPILGNGFDTWLANAESNFMVRDPNIFKYLLILKLPYLVLDIVIALLLMQFFDDEKNKKKVFILWLFNPFTPILLYVFANVDIFPVVLTLAAFLFVKKSREAGSRFARQKLFTAALLFGFASGFKLYPLLFVPFLFIHGRNLKEKLLLALTPPAIFGLISLPFASGAFVQSALVSGLSTRVFNPGVNIGLNETIIVSLLAISVLFFYGAFIDKAQNLFNFWVGVYLLIFSFAHFHIAWLLWLAPFFVVLIVRRPSLKWLFLILAFLAFAIPVLYEDRFMTVGLLRVFSTLYDLLPTPFAVLENFYDPYNLQGILHSILAGGSLVLVYKLFKKEET